MTRECGQCPTGQLGDGETCRINPCFLKNGGCDALTTCAANATTGDAICGACPAGYDRAGDQFTPCNNIDGCAKEPCYALVGRCKLTPVEARLEGGWLPRLKLNYDILLSSVAFNFNLRPYALVLCTDVAPPDVGRTCGACPAGYEGDGVDCTDVDECADGVGPGG